jgi:hypothetical protein
MATNQFDLSGFLVFHTKLTIILGGADSTGLFPPLNQLSLSYEDSAAFKSDNLEIVCSDIGDTLINSAALYKGQTLKVKIDTFNRDYPGHHDSLDTGTFEIDEIEQSGPPSVIRIAATSVPVTGSMKYTLKHYNWKNISLKQLHEQLAERNNLTPVWDVEEGTKEAKYADIQVTDQEQEYESDLKFLSRICNKYGLSVKMTGDRKLVVFSDRLRDEQDAVYTLDFSKPGFNKLLQWNLTSRAGDTYQDANVVYMSGYTGGKTDQKVDIQQGEKPASGETAMGYGVHRDVSAVEDIEV